MGNAVQIKREQLEREIHESNATDTQKTNMIHSLSKLYMLMADERDEWKRRAERHGCDVEHGDPDCA